MRMMTVELGMLLEQPRQNMGGRFRRTDQVVLGGVLVFPAGWLIGSGYVIAGGELSSLVSRRTYPRSLRLKT